MSTATLDPTDSTTEKPTAVPNAKPLRVWPAILMVAAFWAFLYVNHNFELSMFARFMSRLAAYGELLLTILGWWLTRFSIPWRDRLGAVAIAILLGIASAFVTDPTVNGFGYFLSAFPWVVTAWVAWVIIARSFSARPRQIGFCVAMLCVFGYFCLLRFDGVDAAQQSEMSWRWQPTSEETFLSARDTSVAGEERIAERPTAQAWEVRADDCPDFRGRDRNGIVRGVKLATNWKANPPKQLWRRAAGPGWSGLIVVDGHVVTQEQRGEMEVVACCDAATGDEIWVHEDKVRFEESLAGAGPRSTPTFVDGRIYTLGAKGTLNCLIAETGERVWTRDTVADGAVKADEIPQWGYSVSPLVINGLVITFAGGSAGKSVLAYHAADGTPAWTAAAGKQSYSSPQLVELHGVKQVLMHDTTGLTSFNISDGKILWQYESGGETSLPMLQPHQVDSSSLLISTEPGAALLEVKRDGDKWSVGERWASHRFRPAFNDFILHERHMYGLDDGVLCAFELAKGERVWKKGRFGHGQPLMLADQGLVLMSSDKGEIILVSVTPEGHEELGRIQAIEGKTWASPVLAGNRVYIRNGKEMAAFELAKQP